MEGECWFERWTMDNGEHLDFIVGNETIESIGKCVKLTSLSHPWYGIAFYI
jgi:hypothetical protein